VRILGPVSEDRVVAAYEHAARESSRTHHGWRTTPLFDGLPASIDWFSAALAREQVLSILYIDWEQWLALSGGTRRPVDAAARTHGRAAGSAVASHEHLAARLWSDDPPPELIVVTDPPRSRLVLLDGHVRITAYALFPAYLPEELEIFLGEAHDMARWSEW